MKAFLKENIVLVISLSLPLILVVIFSIIQVVSNISIADPKYPVIYTTGKTNPTTGYNVYIKNDKIHYTYQPPAKEQSNYSYYDNNKPRVFIYDHASETQIELDAPPVTDYRNNLDVILEGVSEGEILTTIESPDGYTLEKNDYRNVNIFSIFFGTYNNNSSYDLSLKKKNKRVAIPKIDSSNYNYQARNTHFLGWIEKE